MSTVVSSGVSSDALSRRPAPIQSFATSVYGSVIREADSNRDGAVSRLELMSYTNSQQNLLNSGRLTESGLGEIRQKLGAAGIISSQFNYFGNNGQNTWLPRFGVRMENVIAVARKDGDGSSISAIDLGKQKFDDGGVTPPPVPQPEPSPPIIPYTPQVKAYDTRFYSSIMSEADSNQDGRITQIELNQVLDEKLTALRSGRLSADGVVKLQREADIASRLVKNFHYFRNNGQNRPFAPGEDLSKAPASITMSNVTAVAQKDGNVGDVSLFDLNRQKFDDGGMPPPVIIDEGGMLPPGRAVI